MMYAGSTYHFKLWSQGSVDIAGITCLVSDRHEIEIQILGCVDQCSFKFFMILYLILLVSV